MLSKSWWKDTRCPLLAAANSKAEPPELTWIIWPADPREDKPVPPLVAGKVPAVILLAFKFGILASARVPDAIVLAARPSVQLKSVH